ncbi:extracellular solute-binding protein ['Camptotheca acuminata' phytoplasma]|uniref:extracellular solute-binding protein n=1 Tax='Camptotheca acuminata' phytoplasma TaxID=3239192 RepID=UPI00351A9D57
MVLKDKTQNFLFVFGFFFLLIMYVFIQNYFCSLRYSSDGKTYKANLEKHLKKFKSTEEYENQFRDKSKPHIYINFWHNLYKDEEELFIQIIEGFQKKYPQIKIVLSNKENWGQILKNVSNALNVNKQPNLVFSYPDHIEFYSKSNKLIPLNIFTKKEKELKEENPSFTNLLDIEKHFKEGYIPTHNFGDGEKYYYLPLLKTHEIMFYNKNKIKEFKDEIEKEFKEEFEEEEIIDLKTGEIKTQLTWDQMKKICRIMKEKKGQNFIPILVDSEDNLFIISLEQNKNDKINYPSETNSLEKFFQDSGTQDRISYFKENFGQREKEYLTFSKLSGEYVIPKLMKDDNICFYITSTRRLENLCDIKNSDITWIPKREGDEDKNILQGPNVNLFFSEDNDKNLASWFFLKYLSSFETYKKLLREGKMYDNIYKVENEEEEKKDINEILDSELESPDKKGTFKRQFQKLIRTNLNKKLEDAKQHQKDYFFTSPIFQNSNYLRTVMTDLILKIFSMESYDKTKIGELFEDAYKRLITI